jgi:CRP-like cAMP-binding protein
MSELVEALSRLPHRILSIRASDSVFRTGDPVRFLYLVRSGGIHLTRFDAQGGQAVMQRAVAGMILAEGSIFSDAYHCDGVAVADTELVRVVRNDLRAAAREEPELMEAIARHLAREVQRTRIRIEVLAKKTVRERLDAWLALGDGKWPARGGMAALAQDIGVSPEAFYREMQRRRLDGRRMQPTTSS